MKDSTIINAYYAIEIMRDQDGNLPRSRARQIVALKRRLRKIAAHVDEMLEEHIVRAGFTMAMGSPPDLEEYYWECWKEGEKYFAEYHRNSHVLASRVFDTAYELTLCVGLDDWEWKRKKTRNVPEIELPDSF